MAESFPAWRTPTERVVHPEVFLMAVNPDFVAQGKGLYVLECQHLQIGRLGSRRLHCDRCQAIWDASLDYEGYRAGRIPDPLGNQIQEQG